MKQPKVELKRVSSPRNIHNDSFCYMADVYVNGKKAFTAANDGRGGSDSFQPFSDEGRDLYWLLENYIKTLPKIRDEELDFTYAQDMDTFISGMAVDIIHQRDLKRKANALLKKVVFFKEGDLLSFKGKTEPNVALQPYIDAIERGGTSPVVILNTFSKDVQLKIAMLMFDGDMVRSSVREKLKEILEGEGLTEAEIEQAVTQSGEEPIVYEGIGPR